MPKTKPTSKPRQPKSIFMAFRAEPELAHLMLKLQHRDGITPSEQIRRALRAWLPTKKIAAVAKKSTIIKKEQS